MFELHVPNARERIKHEVIVPTRIMDWVFTHKKFPLLPLCSFVDLLLYMTEWKEKEPLLLEGHVKITTTLLFRMIGVSERKIRKMVSLLSKTEFCNSLKTYRNEIEIKWNWLIREVEDE